MFRPGSPAPADAAIARNVRAYDAVASTYDASHPEIFNSVEQERLAVAVQDVIAACAQAESVPRVLDVGAGTGNLSAHFINAGAVVVSADVSSRCLRVLSDRFRATGRHSVQLIDGRSLADVADATFDVAACYSVLHHVPDYLALVGEMARVVRPGGLVYLDHERHDASWHDPVRAQCMREVVVFPPKRWTRFLDPRKYWNRVRPLFQWHRWRDPRWMPEGDLHIWPDDHIEWARVEARAREAGVVSAIVRDHLLFESHYDRSAWERWKDRVTDYRMWVGRKL
ncbi:MAG: class I SAM-dependent methyltransferase [Gemmatimonadaceae bacterium]